MLSSIITGALPCALAMLIGTCLADDFPTVYVPSTCTDGFQAGSDATLLTVPYPPSAVIEIVGNFNNLTWSGNDPSTITLNGTNNEVNTARRYSLQGLDVIETLDQFYKPDLGCSGTPHHPQVPQYAPDMAYVEGHTLAQIPFGTGQVYMPFDGLTVTSACNGHASALNYSANFCATDPSTTQSTLNSLHSGNLNNVSKMLGGETFTSCGDLEHANLDADSR